MKIILQQNVQKLGAAGDIVETKSGYFRNFLEPRKLAVAATEGTLKKREEDLETFRKRAELVHQDLLALKERIDALSTIRLYAKVGEGGKLYGKITTKEIAAALEKQLATTIDKRVLKTAKDINAIGSYTVDVKLANDVKAQITVEISQEGAITEESSRPNREKPYAKVQGTEEIDTQ